MNFYRVDHAPCFDNNFRDTNADVWSVVASFMATAAGILFRNYMAAVHYNQ